MILGETIIMELQCYQLMKGKSAKFTSLKRLGLWNK